VRTKTERALRTKKAPSTRAQVANRIPMSNHLHQNKKRWARIHKEILMKQIKIDLNIIIYTNELIKEDH
jgi:hypothetical protein